MTPGSTKISAAHIITDKGDLMSWIDWLVMNVQITAILGEP